jgi:RimJ/RimL family protein N-acetyltransferase
MTVPVLETPRLILREYRLDDFPAHAAIWAHPRTTRDFGGYVYDEENCWLRFQRNWGQWALFGYGYWGLEEKAGGRYIGAVGLFNARRDIDVPFRDLPEAGWVLSPDRHGQGLITEALGGAFAWADANIPAPQSWAMINPLNEISQKVAARFGFIRAQDSIYKDKPVSTWLRSRA